MQQSEITSNYRLGMLVYKNFISRYENFKSRDSLSTRNLTQHSGVDDAIHVNAAGWVVAAGKCNDRGSCGSVKL